MTTTRLHKVVNLRIVPERQAAKFSLKRKTATLSLAREVAGLKMPFL